MSANKRVRTIEQENRQFNHAWTDEFLMVPLPSGEMLCLECNHTLRTVKRSNAKQHFDTKHGPAYAAMTRDFRAARVETLKHSRQRQQTMMRGPSDINKKAVLTSTKIAYVLIKKGEIVYFLSFEHYA